MMIKKTLILVLFLCNLILFAQETSPNRQKMMQRVSELRVNMIMDRLALGPEEDKLFRTLLIEYVQKIMQNKKKIMFNLKSNHQNMSNEMADQLIKSHLDEAKQNIVIREDFYNKAIKIISSKQMLKVLHMDRKFEEELRRSIESRMKNRFNDSKKPEEKFPGE